MIDKRSLKYWLFAGDLNKNIEQVEKYIDRQIEKNAKRGKTTFKIRTASWGFRAPEPNLFYELMYDETLSAEKQQVVQTEIIERYRSNGFEVELVEDFSNGRNNYPAFVFKDIDKVLEE